MALLLALFLVLCTIAAFIVHKRKVGLTLFSLAVIWTFFVGYGFLPKLLMQRLHTQPSLASPEWKTNNVIVILGGGTVESHRSRPVRSTFFSYSRIYEAMRLYFDCRKHSKNCSILPSGGDPLKHKVSEAETMGRELKALGVPKTDLILESNSNNTYQNAQFSSAMIRSRSFDQIILVTSGVHMTRSLLYFSNFQLYPTAAPSDYLDTPGGLALISFNFLLADVGLHEYMGILRFHIYNKLGWNKVTSAATVP